MCCGTLFSLRRFFGALSFYIFLHAFTGFGAVASACLVGAFLIFLYFSDSCVPSKALHGVLDAIRVRSSRSILPLFSWMSLCSYRFSVVLWGLARCSSSREVGPTEFWRFIFRLQGSCYVWVFFSGLGFWCLSFFAFTVLLVLAKGPLEKCLFPFFRVVGPIGTYY